MAIDFPNSPTSGDSYTVGDKSWQWDGAKWIADGAFISPSILKVDQANSRVGIGTATPQKTFHMEQSDSGVTPGASHHAVFESSADNGLLIASGTTSNGRMRFGDSDSAVVGGFDYDHADDSLKIRTAGSDHVTINSSGDVGIGTTAPINEFHVAVDGAWGGASSTLHSIITSRDDDNGIGVYSGNTKNGYIRFGDTDSQSSGGFNYDHNTDTMLMRVNGVDRLNLTDGELALRGNTSGKFVLQTGSTGTTGQVVWRFTSSSTEYATMGIEYDNRASDGFLLDVGYPITIDSTTYTNFKVAGSQKMRLNSDGSLCVGASSTVDNANVYIWDSTSYGRLRISGSGTGYTHADVLLKMSDNQRGAGIYMFNSHNDKNWFMGNPNPTPDNWQVSRYSSSVFREATANTSTSYQRFVVDSGGACYNKTGTYGTISDLRLKTDVETARSYLADLNDIRVITYRIDKYEDINEDTGELEFFPLDEPSDKMLGFAAQEIEEVFPAMIGTGGSGVKAVKQSVLVPMLLTAVQELSARIETLETA